MTLSNLSTFELYHIGSVQALWTSCVSAFWFSWEEHSCVSVAIASCDIPGFIFMYTHSSRRTQILRPDPHARMAKHGHTDISGTEELEASAAPEHPDTFKVWSCLFLRCFRIPFSCNSIILKNMDTLFWFISKSTEISCDWHYFAEFRQEIMFS